MECDPTRWDFSIYLGSGIINSVCLFWSVSLQICNIAQKIILWHGRSSHSFYIWQCWLYKYVHFWHSYGFMQLPSLFIPLWDIKTLAWVFSKCVWMDEKARISLSNLKIPWDRRVFRLTGSSKYSKWLCQLRIISCWLRTV